MTRRLTPAATADRMMLRQIVAVGWVSAIALAGQVTAADGQPARLPAVAGRIAKTKTPPPESHYIREPQDEALPMFNPAELQASVVVPPPITRSGYSSSSLRNSAVAALQQSSERLAHRASLSAAAAATEALRLVAQSIDTERRDNSASTEVDRSLIAIREAEDFVDRYGMVDSSAISRMVRSHETTTLKGVELESLSGLAAADAYLDGARRQLVRVAGGDPLAGEAIQMLAKAYRQRAGESSLVTATAVHLMRAAYQTMPSNRETAAEMAAVLGEAHLDGERQQVLAKMMQLPAGSQSTSDDWQSVVAVVSGTSGGTNAQTIQIANVSPEAFASVSGLQTGPSGPVVSEAKSTATGSPANRSADRTAPVSDASESGNALMRTLKAMTRRLR